MQILEQFFSLNNVKNFTFINKLFLGVMETILQDVILALSF